MGTPFIHFMQLGFGISRFRDILFPPKLTSDPIRQMPLNNIETNHR
ncbi:hypothetical protein KSS87_014362 [Heliosperma pusillum]|nr:hypothetical protein KSS87_014362 [Heliosperma pusillum]